VSYFSEFSRGYLQLLATICEQKINFKFGEKIFKEGDLAEEIFVVVEGQVKLSRLVRAKKLSEENEKNEFG
jgi:CRP-like cAMP-binding protein